MAFTKLHTELLTSTVWTESHPTRIVWITMLAMADAQGRVKASLPGLAHIARVTREECEHALERFMLPDRDSRTEDHDGRRLEKIDGGWRILNYLKYREIRDPDTRRAQTREAMQRLRAREPKKANVSQSEPLLAQAEAEAEAEETLKARNPSGSLSGRARRLAALGVLKYLNQLAGKNFQPVKANVGLIEARLREFSESQLRGMIEWKCSAWKGDDRMVEYLRPETLFGATKCAQYVGELPAEEGLFNGGG